METWTDRLAEAHLKVDYLVSAREEADTELLLHGTINETETETETGTEVSARHPSAVDIFSPDTDVLVLAVR